MIPGISFRLMSTDDHGLLYRWLTNDAVARWWDRPASLVDFAREYDPAAPKNADMTGYIIEVDATPIGYIQRYDGPGPGEQGVDLFIGDDAYRHRGFGPAAIGAFVAQHIFSDASTKRCVVDPSPDNTSAIRAYEKAGFTADRTRSSATVLVLTLDRP